jgi:2-polyprenyl-3-methyl-5-hydroxy-6-metoxy-1,4-benzoquinol methylase
MTTANCPSLADQEQYWNARWDQTRTPNQLMARRGDTLLNILRSLPLQNPKILDLGCGTGWFTGKLAQLGEATGIDLSETAIAIAKSQFPHVKFMATNLFEHPLPAKHFDVIVSQEVIAHVQDQVGYVERIAATLKPHGYLVITTANKFMVERVSWPQQPPSHIEKWFTLRLFKRLLNSHFRVLKTMTIMPVGDRGIYSIINSRKLNIVLGWMIANHRLEAFKEWAGLGYTLIAVAQKRD